MPLIPHIFHLYSFLPLGTYALTGKCHLEKTILDLRFLKSEFNMFSLIWDSFNRPTGTFLIDLFVREGETVNLTCQIAMDDLSWRGPPNLTLYASGSDKCNLTNIHLSHLEKTKDNILKIFKFEAKHEGNYQCSSLLGGDQMFNVKLLRK